MSESLKLGHNLDFSSCDIMVGFHKSSHKCAMSVHNETRNKFIDTYATSLLTPIREFPTFL